MSTLEPVPPGAGALIRSRRRRRAFALTAVAVALLSSATYWLASAGTTGPSISPPAGAPAGGEVAKVTEMSASVTRGVGAAQVQTGVALAKLETASVNADAMKVAVYWTNAEAAGRVLNSPNAQISIGLYHPIHTGKCKTSSAGSVVAPLVAVSENEFCVELDEGATGSSSVSESGKLLLAPNIVGGYLQPSIAASSAVGGEGGEIAACATATEDEDVWCKPSGTTTSQRVLYVVASIVTPGGIPKGQQPSLNELSFYVRATKG